MMRTTGGKNRGAPGAVRRLQVYCSMSPTMDGMDTYNHLYWFFILNRAEGILPRRTAKMLQA